MIIPFKILEIKQKYNEPIPATHWNSCYNFLFCFNEQNYSAIMLFYLPEINTN